MKAPDLKAQISFVGLAGPNKRPGETIQTALNIVEFTFQAQRTKQSIYTTGRRAAQKIVDLVATFLRYRNRGEWIVQHSVEQLRLVNPNNPSEIHTIQTLIHRPTDTDVVMTEIGNDLAALTLLN